MRGRKDALRTTSNLLSIIPVNLQSKIAWAVLGRLFRADIKVPLKESALEYEWKGLLASEHVGYFWRVGVFSVVATATGALETLGRVLDDSQNLPILLPHPGTVDCLANRASLYFRLDSLQRMGAITRPTAAPCRAELMFLPGFSTSQPIDQ